MAIKEQNIGSTEPATKGDIEQAREDIHLDIENAVQASEKRVLQGVHQSKEEIIHEFRAAIETIHRDLAGANKDEISLIKDKQKDHTKRIDRLEQQAGLA